MIRAALAVAVMAAGIALGADPAPKAKTSRAPAKKPAATRKAPRGDGGSAALEIGTLVLNVQGDVTAYLDGRELGKPPFKPVKVLAGAHRLRLVNEALQIDQTLDVEVKPNQRQTMEISFE